MSENFTEQQRNYRLQISASDGPIPVSKSDFLSKAYLENEYVEVQCSYLQQLYRNYETALLENARLTTKLAEAEHKAVSLDAALAYCKYEAGNRIRLNMRA